MKRVWLILPSAFALAHCSERSSPPTEASQSPGVNEYKVRIDRLDTGQRDAVMLRAVRDAGHDCQGVVGSAYNGEQFGMPAWAARCRDGRDWLVMIRKDGSALVAAREEAPAP